MRGKKIVKLQAESVDAIVRFVIQFEMFAELESVDLMRRHLATKSLESSAEEGFAITSQHKHKKGTLICPSPRFSSALPLPCCSS